MSLTDYGDGAWWCGGCHGWVEAICRLCRLCPWCHAPSHRHPFWPVVGEAI